MEITNLKDIYSNFRNLLDDKMYVMVESQSLLGQTNELNDIGNYDNINRMSLQPCLLYNSVMQGGHTRARDSLFFLFTILVAHVLSQTF